MDQLKPEILQLGPNGWMPNNAHLPVLIYHGVARKMADKTLPSNALMPNWAKSDGKPI